jgi:hypothetical protein
MSTFSASSGMAFKTAFGFSSSKTASGLASTFSASSGIASKTVSDLPSTYLGSSSTGLASSSSFSTSKISYFDSSSTIDSFSITFSTPVSLVYK